MVPSRKTSKQQRQAVSKSIKARTSDSVDTARRRSSYVIVSTILAASSPCLRDFLAVCRVPTERMTPHRARLPVHNHNSRQRRSTVVPSHVGRRVKELSVSTILMRLPLSVTMFPPFIHVLAPACGDRARGWRSVAARGGSPVPSVRGEASSCPNNLYSPRRGGQA